ncbi:PAS domain-containing protein [Devosia sp. YIM 151766]|uniref:PAS domain-containing protein n=1 Tax=Devosia sp. YIM 151766 TaxID=3017325 RepID=UPI00255C4110|nr:PAS domain-containing protein [Devosia sp. YIM 151766]WIY53731.1 PAS domain-containing protein [Devosia sp. YIM 151766]
MPRSLFPAATPETRARLDLDPTIKLFNDFDWASNPLGLIADWPDGLKGAVRAMIVASIPMYMLVGPQGILLYNNAYAQFAGRRHPEIFGLSAAEAWPEIAAFHCDNIERGLRGESWTLSDQELTLARHGQAETIWMDLHCSPVVGEDGRSMGLLCILHETTDRVLAEQAVVRNEERLTLALSSSSLVGTWDWNMADDLVTADDQFAEMFGIDPLRAGLGVPLKSFFRSVHPDDLDNVKAEIRRSSQTLDEFRCEFRLIGEDGSIRWVVAAGRPRQNAAGQLYRFPGIAIDITEQHRTAEALAESELRFRTLADTMPQRVWTALPDGTVDYVNARWHEFVGHENLLDRQQWLALIHPDDRLQADERRSQATAAGEPYQLETRMRHRSGEYRWSLSRALPVHDANGQLVRWIGTATDIHETRLAAEERELVAQELGHRIKNIFAVLNGIVGLSARSYPEARSFADDLRQRIYALGEAHDFVRPHSHLSVSGAAGQGRLSALIARLMSPYRDGEVERVLFSGEDVSIDDAAATPLALLFHELATNAAKYGALCQPQGRVHIAGEDAGEDFCLTWTENGGPETRPPDALSGFGTKLIGLSVEGQMRGTLERDWRPEGLHVKIVVPRNALNRSMRLRAAPDEESV